MNAPAFQVTNELFQSYLDCPTKAVLKARGVAGARTEYEALNASDLQVYRDRARDHILRRYGNPDGTRPPGPVSLEDAVAAATPLAFDVDIVLPGVSARCDALARLPGDPPGNCLYAPLMVSWRQTVTKDERLLLGFLANALGQANGGAVSYGIIVQGENFSFRKIRLQPLLVPCQRILKHIHELVRSETRTTPRLASHCVVCMYHDHCLRKAREKDHLSLLRALREKEIQQLNRRGIFTVTQYSYTFRPRRTKTLGPPRHDHALRALAIRTEKIHVAKRPNILASDASVYMDVEGDADSQLYYLVGLHILKNGNEQRVQLWADNRDEERRVWLDLLEIVADFPAAVVYHYGNYETVYVRRMQTRYGGDLEGLQHLQSNSFNLLAADPLPVN